MGVGRPHRRRQPLRQAGLGTVGSFSIRNPEIRQEMLVEFDSNGIRYWINADGSIGYFLEDGKQIDKIGNLVIAEYITRN